MASRIDQLCGKSPDFHSLTLPVKLPMSAVYQLMPSTIAAAVNSLGSVGRR
jgi:hypothetical protein